MIDGYLKQGACSPLTQCIFLTEDKPVCGVTKTRTLATLSTRLQSSSSHFLRWRIGRPKPIIYFRHPIWMERDSALKILFLINGCCSRCAMHLKLLLAVGGFLYSIHYNLYLKSFIYMSLVLVIRNLFEFRIFLILVSRKRKKIP